MPVKTVHASVQLLVEGLAGRLTEIEVIASLLDFFLSF